MSNGWKLAALKRRQGFLADRLDDIRADGGAHHRATKYDRREYDALDWAIGVLEASREVTGDRPQT